MFLRSLFLFSFVLLSSPVFPFLLFTFNSDLRHGFSSIQETFHHRKRIKIIRVSLTLLFLNCSLSLPEFPLLAILISERFCFSSYKHLSFYYFLCRFPNFVLLYSVIFTFSLLNYVFAESVQGEEFVLFE